MIPGPPVDSVHGRGEPNGSERHVPGSLDGPISAARSERSDRERRGDRRSEPSDREGGSPYRGSDRAGDGDRSPGGTEDLEAEIRRLEAEIERKDRHHRRIIARYERLLAERDRKLAEERPEPTGGAWSTVRSAVARLLRGDR